MRRMLRFGLPNGFQFFIEGAAITVFVLIIAQISDDASAATALAFSVNMIVFIPVIGLSFAITTLVGQQIGEGRPALAAQATWSGLYLGLAYTSLFAVMYTVVPGWFLAMHEAGSDNFVEIRKLSENLLRFVAIYCIFDTIQIVFVAAIKGAGDTVFVVVFTILSSACFLLVGFFIASQLSSDTISDLVLVVLSNRLDRCVVRRLLRSVPSGEMEINAGN